VFIFKRLYQYAAHPGIFQVHNSGLMSLLLIQPCQVLQLCFVFKYELKIWHQCNR